MRKIVMDLKGQRGRLIKIFCIFLSLLLFITILTINIMPAEADGESAEQPDQTQAPQETVPVETQQSEPELEPAAAELAADAQDEPEELTEANGNECVSRQVIVKFKNNAAQGLAVSIIKSLGSEVDTQISGDGLLLVDVPADETMEDFTASLYENANVEYVQPNYVYTLNQTVNDPYASSNQWYLEKIRAYDAWDITMGDADIKVAVIDSGIDLSHPEFSGKIYAQKDVVDYDGSAQDDNGHGTHVAGIIAATADNGIGIAGVAPGVKLIIVDASGPSYASTADIVEGLDFAVEQGADVVNISLGCYLNDTALQAAIQSTVNAGIIVVAAAGNDGTSDAHYPSDYEPVISVTATDFDDGIIPISNYGSQKDISAPGLMIYSTYTNAAGYTSMTGTSTASPMVAAVAALILSVNPDLSVSEVKDILYSTSVDLGDPGRDDYYGYGRLDAYAAVTAATATVEDTYTVSVETSNPAYGTVSGGGDYEGGTEATVTASPKVNCSFESWTNDGQVVSTDAQYTFTVTADVALRAVFRQGDSQQITSDVYDIDREKSLIKNVTVNTALSDFKAKLTSASADIHIYDKEGTECFDGVVASGMKAALVSGGEVQDELTISVLGDISGDGVIDITDILYIRAEVTDTYCLNDCECAAAEINKDGVIDITDILYIRAHVIGSYSIIGS